MDALILSCSTGGGHNAAGRAAMEALEARGHHARLLDPYELVSPGLGKKVGDTYVGMVQRAPRMFGCVYSLGELYRKLPIHSPVYWVNENMGGVLETYLRENPCDVILMPHVFPAEILTNLKAKGVPVPKTVFIATDYTCIPFTEETNCDYYVIPSPRLRENFLFRGIPEEKLLPFGIPVKGDFSREISREEAAETLGLDLNRHYLLLAGGSIGAGNIRDTMEHLRDYLKNRPDTTLITICGRHQQLYLKLLKEFGGDPQMVLLSSTDKMPEYMALCDVIMTKPGGLTSTEAAVAGIPLIHISPIPGCEQKNAAFFEAWGMSLRAGDSKRELISALETLEQRPNAENMVSCQRREINPNSARDLAIFLENWMA